MQAPAALPILLVVLAGCNAPTATPGDAPAPLIEGRPDTTYGDVVTGPAVEPDWNATTEAAPVLVPGEWWRVRYEFSVDGIDSPVEVVRVVAAVDEAGYVFGMPHEGWLKEAISFHAPAFGDVNFDLSYNTHNMLFQPLQFPLVAGATWQTHMTMTEYVAEVTQADQHTATIVFTPAADPEPTDPVYAALGLAGGGAMTITYDARQHEVVRMESAIGTWEVIEHGYGFEGWVTVPRGEDTAIDYGTFGPASQAHSPLERTLTVADGFNRMTMMHFVGTLNEAPAHIVARDVAPDGTEHVTEMTGSGFKLAFYEVKDPSGTWTVQDTVAGAGFTYHMGIAYFQYDIRLPDGARRADHSHEVIR